MADHLVYEILTESLKKEVRNTYIIEKEKQGDLLGIDFTTESIPITKDGKIEMPAFMIARFKSDSVAQKSGLRIGSVIQGINGKPVTIDTYHEEIAKHTSFSINVDESFCDLYQFLITDPEISERFNFYEK